MTGRCTTAGIAISVSAILMHIQTSILAMINTADEGESGSGLTASAIVRDHRYTIDHHMAETLVVLPMAVTTPAVPQIDLHRTEPRDGLYHILCQTGQGPMPIRGTSKFQRALSLSGKKRRQALAFHHHHAPMPAAPNLSHKRVMVRVIGETAILVTRPIAGVVAHNEVAFKPGVVVDEDEDEDAELMIGLSCIVAGVALRSNSQEWLKVMRISP